jgi:hypothetical protein
VAAPIALSGEAHDSPVKADLGGGRYVPSGDGRLYLDAHGRVWINPGQVVRMRVGYSEVACHLRVCGLVMDVQLTSGEYPMAQLYRDGRAYSAPITTGEAGIFGCRRDGFYAYPDGL